MDQLSEPLVISDLSIAERILVVEQVWDSIAAEQASLSITSAQQKELDRRLCTHRESTSEGASWEETKARLLDNK